MKNLMAILSLSLVIACDDAKETTCSPTGTWQIEDTRISTTGGSYCESADLATNVSSVQLTYDGTSETFTWTEDGDSFTGTINRSTCEGTVTATKQVTFTDDDDNEQVLTMTASRTFTIRSTYTGTANVSIYVTGGLEGVPCQAIYDSAGTHQ